MLADDELDVSDPESISGWTEDARDLIEGSRLQAKAGSAGFSGLADQLESGVEVSEAEPAAAAFVFPAIEKAMNDYLVYCDPYAEDYFSGGG